MSIKDRIDEFIEYKGLNIKAFEQEIGISNGLWSKAKTVSEDVLLKVITRYPEIDSNWLLKGVGTMFGSDACDNEETSRLQEENAKLREELRRKEDPDQPSKESEIYRLWMEHMRITEKMQELYQKEKEG